jgi:hypothetical protein
MSPNLWLTVGMAVALIGFPLVSVGLALWARLTNRSTAERGELDTSVPGRTIPGGDD